VTSSALEDQAFEPACIGRYTLLSRLGSGGSAEVYLAELTGQGGFRRLVAIKRVHNYLRSEQEFVNMFLDEARIAGSMRHPNVIGIHEVQADLNDCYLVMDYVDGMTLGDMSAAAEARNAMLPFSASIAIMLDVLAGLQCAHDLANEQGEPMHVVHRDVSPANVIVGLDGTARVGDFGIARATSRLTRTQPGIVKGRFLYMAPEQGMDDILDRRADVYSAGAVLWELLAGSRLGTRETLSPTALLRPTPDVRERNPEVPPMLAAVCATALEVSPGRRWSSAAEFAHHLENAARAEIPIASRPELAQLVANLRGTLDESGARRRAAPRPKLAGPRRGQLVRARQVAPQGDSALAKDAPTMQLRLRVAHRTVAALLVLIATFSALLEAFARRLRAMKKDPH
jgi:serine/threonine protein kinase